MPKTVILNAMLGQGHLSPLVGIATQLQARDDYEVQFLVNAVDRDAVVKQFASMAPAAAAARFEAEGAVAYDDPTRFEAIFSDMMEKGCMHLVGFNDARQAAVDAAVDDVLKTRDAGDVVGVVDFMSLAAGRALFKRGIPYYVTFPGPAGMLSVFGCADMPLPLELVAPYVATRVVPSRAAKESEIPNFKGSYLGRFPLVSADFWTSDHLLERSRSVDVFFGSRARGTLTLKRR